MSRQGRRTGLRVAAEWFAFEEVADGVTRIWEPNVHSFMQANIWHLRGREADLVVDSGMGVGDLAGALLARGLAGDRPLLLVVTHCHADHAGGAHQFWPCAVHVAEAELLARPPAWRPLLVRDYESVFRGCFVWAESVGGLARDEQAAAEAGVIIRALPAPGFDPVAFAAPGATPTMQVQEGDVLDVGGRSFRVLHLPGHSPGSVGLWAEDAGVLLAGDVVYDSGELLDEMKGSSVPDYCATLRRLRELPVQTVYAGHGRPFGRDLLGRRIEEYLGKRA